MACCVHKNTELNKMFQNLVNADSETHGQKIALDQCVVTRWNTDFSCISAHVILEKAVRRLASNGNPRIKQFFLSEPQWSLATQLKHVLMARYIYGLYIIID
jgi:hypothetical protein